MRPVCVPEVVRSRVASPERHRSASSARRQRVLTIAGWIAAVVSAAFGVFQLTLGGGLWWLGVVNIICGAAFLTIPRLCSLGELIAPLTFVGFAYVSVGFICFTVGTGSGLQFYFLVSAALAVLILGIERIALASAIAALGVAICIVLELTVPHDRGLGPSWTLTAGFLSSVASSAVMLVATIWYTLREIQRAERAMEAEYERSEQLLANILPETIAERLKEPSRDVIADKYDDASILFADIAGYTERASNTTPAELVRFLDRLYTDLDALVDRHGLEKVKTSGDAYMVVSGVPIPRADHLEALAALALDIADTVAAMKDAHGHAVPLRIGMAAGPVVAGVVGAKKFFYDVWGDAVNVASRMETTDIAGRIQVPEDVYLRLRHAFAFEERGLVEVKGKGVMHTWYLVGHRAGMAVSAIPSGSPT
ncbi:adenylate/guanylate cyclase domain-containing protein [Mycolicibacterium duvalii]|uniref:adenylate/guanylate cyclase domain-containing protein n=1 Tax=Mycolicibacterium duvalii TaxID=39688 RepID=UPI000BEED578|nr:adenylate/guanylate cyclase domain-containing protein [Mycolicibacterium duvalii]MCV7366886.1 adenylate/guanylate cyclase domain-containing protein [Mycolicibacterium duvalii]PEG44048.1 adenylate/guanylate cyclase domain-containing protein [Mycolicibacterium duvalii]